MKTRNNARGLRTFARMSKKVLSVFLAAVLVATSFSFVAFADEGQPSQSNDNGASSYNEVVVVDFAAAGTKVKDQASIYGDPLAADWGFDNWPDSVPRDVFDIVYYRHTNNENIGVHEDELRAMVLVRASYAGLYTTVSQPLPGNLTISEPAFPIDPREVLDFEGYFVMADRLEHVVSYAKVRDDRDYTGTLYWTTESPTAGTANWQTNGERKLIEHKQTNPGKYHVWYKFVGDGDYAGLEVVTPRVTGTIGAYGYDDLEIHTYRTMYNGENQLIARAAMSQGSRLTGVFVYSFDGLTYHLGNEVYAKDAGNYDMWFRLIGNGDYAGGNYLFQADSEITPAPLPEGALQVEGYKRQYDSTDQVVAAAKTPEGSDFTGIIEYTTHSDPSAPEAVWIESDEVRATNVDTYTVWFRLTGTGNYASDSVVYKQVTGKIDSMCDLPPEVKYEFITTSYTQTYTGSPQVIASVKLADSNQTGTFEYSINESPWMPGSEAKATDVGTYNVHFRFTANGNYKGTATTDKPVEGRITAASFDDLVMRSYTTMYNGSSQRVASAHIHEGSSLTGYFMYSLDGFVYSLGNECYATEAGSYNVWFKFIGSDDYTGEYIGKIAGQIIPADLPTDALQAEGYECEYNGNDQVVAAARILEGSDFTGIIEYTTHSDPFAPEAVWIESGEVTASEKNTYTVWFRLTGTGNYASDSVVYKQVTGKIDPVCELPPPEEYELIATGYTWTYTGSPQVVASVTLADSNQTGTFEYSIDDGPWLPGNEAKATDVGTYKVNFRFTANGNYVGEARTDTPVEGRIVPLDISNLNPTEVFTLTPYDLIFNNSPLLIADAKLNDSKYTGDFSYTTADPALNLFQPGTAYYETPVGNYPVTFRFTGTGNYTGTLDQTVTGIIYPFCPPNILETVFYEDLEYSGDEQVIATVKVIEMDPAWTGTLTYSVNGGPEQPCSLTDATEVKATAAGDYTITFTAEGTGNFVDINGVTTHTVTIAKKNINPTPGPELTVSAYTELVYNGTPQTLAVAECNSEITGDFTYTITGDNGYASSGTGNTAMATDAGTYTIVFSFVGSGDYTGKATMTITGRILPQPLEPQTPDQYLNVQAFIKSYTASPQVVAKATLEEGITGDIYYQPEGKSDWIKGYQYEETEGGIYPVIFKLIGTGNYTGEVTKQVSGKIDSHGDVFPDYELTATSYRQIYTGNPQVVASAALADSNVTGIIYYTTNPNWKENPDESIWILGDSYSATEVGLYPVAFRAVLMGNYSGVSYASTTGMIDPYQSNNVLETAFNKGLEYNGGEQVLATVRVAEMNPAWTGTLTYSVNGGPEQPCSLTDTTDVKATDPGDYEIVFTAIGTGNFAGINETVSEVVTIEKVIIWPEPTITVETDTTLEYNGAPQTIATAWTDSWVTGEFTYTVTGDNGYSSSGTGNTVTATDAGTYNIEFTFTGSGEFKGTMMAMATNKILPKPIDSEPGVHLKVQAYDAIYDGTPQVIAEAMVVGDVTGEISYQAEGETEWTNSPQYLQTDAGAYKVTFMLVGTGNYIGAVHINTVGTIIRPHHEQPLIATGYTKQYDGKAQTVVSAEIAPGYDFTGNIQYTLDGGVTWLHGFEYAATDAGDYTINFRLIGTGNSTGTYFASATGTIIPFDLNQINPAEAFTLTPRAVIYNGSPQVVADAKLTNNKYTGSFSYTTADPALNLFQPGTEYYETNVGSYPVTFRFIGAGNYTGELSQQTTGEIYPSCGTRILETTFKERLEYTGEPLVIATVKPVDWSPETGWTGTLTYNINGGPEQPCSLTDITEVTATEPGDYTVTFTATGTGDYIGVDETVSGMVTITKLFVCPEILVTTSTGLRYNGQPQVLAVASADGITGDFSYTITGTRGYSSSGTGNTVMATDADEYTIVFTLANSDAFEGELTKTVTCMLYPIVCDFPENIEFSTMSYRQIYTGHPLVVASAAVADNKATGTIYYTTDPDWLENPDAALWIEGDTFSATEPDVYSVGFKFVGTGNYTGTVYASAEGTIVRYHIGEVLIATGYTMTYNGSAQTIAKAEIAPGYNVTGNIEYSLDSGATWFSGSEYTATDARDYKVAFRVTDTGVIPGTYYTSITCGITPLDISNLDPAEIFALGSSTETYTGSPLLMSEAVIIDKKYTGEFSYTTADPALNLFQPGNAYYETNVGTYPVTFRFTGTGNYTGTLDQQATGIISPYSENRILETYAPADLTYNGKPQVIATVKVKDWSPNPAWTGTLTYNINGGPEVPCSITELTEVMATKAGEYIVTFTATGTGNFAGVDEVISHRVYIVEIIVCHEFDVIPSTGLVYNGAPQTLAVATSTATCDYTYTIIGINGTTDQGAGNVAQATNAGTYFVEFTFICEEASPGSLKKTVTVDIAPQPLDPQTPSQYLNVQTYEPIFNANPQTVAEATLAEGVTGEIYYQREGETDWTKGASYQEENAGLYPVTFKLVGTGNYTGEVTKQVTAELKPRVCDFGDPNTHIVTSYSKTYTGESQMVASITPKESDITAIITYTTDPNWKENPNGVIWREGSTYSATDVGQHPATFRIILTGNNVGEVYALTTGEITPAPVPVDALQVKEYTHYYNGNKQTIANAEVNELYTGTIEHSIDGGPWTAGSEAQAIDEGDYSVQFRFTASGNYTGMIEQIVVGSIKSTSPPVEPNLDFEIITTDRVYNASEQVIAKANLLEGSTGELYYKITSTMGYSSTGTGDTVKAEDAGVYTIEYTLVGTGNYAGTLVKTATVTVKPAVFPPLTSVALRATPYTQSYNGKPQTVATATPAESYFTGTIYYTTDVDWQTNPAANWIEGNTYKETLPGTYPVAFKLVGTGNFEGSTSYAVTMGTIQANEVGVPLKVTNVSKQYNGSAQTIATAEIASGSFFEGRIEYTLDGGITWLPGNEYKQTEVGNYVAAFRLIGTGNSFGNYTAEVACAITPAPLTGDWKSLFTTRSSSASYDGGKKIIVEAELLSSDYEGTFQHSLDGGVTWQAGNRVEATEAGTYDVLFIFTATGNHSGTVAMSEPASASITATPPTNPEAPIVTEPPVVVNPPEVYTTPSAINVTGPSVVVDSPSVVVNAGGSTSGGGGVTVVEVPTPETPAATATTETAATSTTAANEKEIASANTPLDQVGADAESEEDGGGLVPLVVVAVLVVAALAVLATTLLLRRRA